MLDGDYYEKVQDFLTSVAGTEHACAKLTNECFQQVMDEASKVNLSITA